MPHATFGILNCLKFRPANCKSYTKGKSLAHNTIIPDIIFEEPGQALSHFNSKCFIK